MAVLCITVCKPMRRNKFLSVLNNSGSQRTPGFKHLSIEILVKRILNLSGTSRSVLYKTTVFISDLWPLFLKVTVFIFTHMILLLDAWLFSISLSLWLCLSFLILYRVGRTPWTGDQPVARPLPIHRTRQTQNKHTPTSMPLVGLEPTISALERAKTVHALNCAATVIGLFSITAVNFSRNGYSSANFATVYHSVPSTFRTLHALTQHRQNYYTSTMTSVDVPSVQTRSVLLWYSYLQAFDEDGRQEALSSERYHSAGGYHDLF
jgi:hypothetical protein